MKLLFKKGLHNIALIGDVSMRDGKFITEYSVGRDFDKYHVYKEKKRITLNEVDNHIYDFALPEPVFDEVNFFNKAVSTLIQNLHQLTGSTNIKADKYDKHLIRKSDYCIIHRINDYAGVSQFYDLIDNMSNRRVRICVGDSWWNLKNIDEVSMSGKIYQLTQAQFNVITNNIQLSVLNKYSELCNFIIKAIEYTTGERYPECDKLK